MIMKPYLETWNQRGLKSEGPGRLFRVSIQAWSHPFPSDLCQWYHEPPKTPNPQTWSSSTFLPLLHLQSCEEQPCKLHLKWPHSCSPPSSTGKVIRPRQSSISSPANCASPGSHPVECVLKIGHQTRFLDPVSVQPRTASSPLAQEPSWAGAVLLRPWWRLQCPIPVWPPRRLSLSLPTAPPHGPGSQPGCEGICPDAFLPQGHVVERALDCVTVWMENWSHCRGAGGGAACSGEHCTCSDSASGMQKRTSHT